MATVREHISNARQKVAGHATRMAQGLVDQAVPELRHAFREVGDKQLLRANVRTVAGSTLASYIKDKATQSRRGGNFALHAALMLAHKYVSGYQERTATEQRLFENTARVRRGDIAHMSTVDLRSVHDHAAQYGGSGLHDQAHLQASVEGELKRRENVRTREKEAKASERMSNEAAQRRGHAAQYHAQHLQQTAETHQQKILHGAQQSAAQRREASIAHQQQLEHDRATLQNRSALKQGLWQKRFEARAEIKAKAAGSRPAAPRPPAQVFHGKKAGTLYTLDRSGKKHYITHKVQAPITRPRRVV